MEWNEDMIARLRTLWAEGHSTAEIGRRLSVSKNAVVGKAHRLGLTPRPSPIRRDGGGPAAARVAPARRTVGPTLPPLTAEPAAPLDSAEDAERVPADVPAPRPVAAEPAVARLVALPPSAPPAVVAVPSTPTPPMPAQAVRAMPPPRAARQAACCWPIGEPGTKSFRFCDEGAQPGKPYCTAHAQLAYVKVRDRREEAA